MNRSSIWPAEGVIDFEGGRETFDVWENTLSFETSKLEWAVQSLIRARRPDGVELKIDLIELEAALEGAGPGTFYLLPDSGRIVFVDSDDVDDDDDELETLDGVEALSIDPVESRNRFNWMQDFVESVRSITAQNALHDALRHKKPFRNFKDSLIEFPVVRAQWFQYEAQRLKQEALDFIEGLDWEIVEIIDGRASEIIAEQIDPTENVPLTEEEHECILRGAWQIAAKGGITQLALLLKGSKNKAVLKHGLDRSLLYGSLSYLTIEEIENRIPAYPQR